MGSPLRAPLLWLLGPLAVGIVGAPWIDVSVGYLLGPALVLAVVAGAQALRKTWTARGLWAGCLVTAGVLLGAAYALLRAPAYPADWEALPAREVFLTVKIDRLFRAEDRFGYASGIATIMEADFPADDLRGTTTAFYLKPAEGVPVPGRSGRYAVRGVVRFLDVEAELSGYTQYLVNTGVYFDLRQGRLLAETQPPVALWQKADAWRARLQDALLAEKPATGEGEILAAMFLGQRSLLTRAQKEDFIASGTMHLFAISGLHVATVAALLHLLLSIGRLPRWAQATLGLLLLLAYVLVTGAGPSAVRAYLMVGFIWVARLWPRPSNPLAALVASALVVLIWSPQQLFTAGFQLSYAVVAMLILYGAPLALRWRGLMERRWAPWAEAEAGKEKARGRPHWLGRWAYHLGLRTGEAFAFSFAAWLGSAALVGHYFGVFTPLAVFLNLGLMALGGLAVTAAALASLGTLLLGPLWTSLYAHAGWLLVALMQKGVAGFLWLPGSTFAVSARHPAGGFVLTVILLATSLALASRSAPRGLRWWLPPGKPPHGYSSTLSGWGRRQTAGVFALPKEAATLFLKPLQSVVSGFFRFHKKPETPKVWGHTFFLVPPLMLHPPTSRRSRRISRRSV